jgi:prepilin-type N-terminal cleavage/methylation domain-containing protein
MCKRPTRKKACEPNGFTLLEVLVSIAILAIGLMSAALLMSITFKDSVRSRYAAEAAQLASEKLEDLNRYPVAENEGVFTPDFHIEVPAGSTCSISGETCVGSIAAALTCGTTPGSCVANPGASPNTFTDSAGGNVVVDYSDSVYITATDSSSGSSSPNGTLQETYQTQGGSSPQYTTLTFSPAGGIPVISNPASAPPSGETFDRRWLIEQNEPVSGVRRITVLVTLMDQTVQPTVTFQMSMVRP